MGKRIREIRKNKQMMQEDLAACVASPRKRVSTQDLEDSPTINRSAIADYETGRRLPNLRTLIAVAEALEVDVLDLLIDPEESLGQRVALEALGAGEKSLKIAASALGVGP